jgi:hypothetical protein
VWHDWWNEAEADAVVRVEVTPGERFVHMIETLFGLAREGHVDAKGMPSALQLASPRRSSPTSSCSASRRAVCGASSSAR